MPNPKDSMIKPLFIPLAVAVAAALLSASCDKPGPVETAPQPVAGFSWSGARVAPAQIAFVNLSANADVYRWEFGDGTVSADSAPIHIYSAPGAYNVSLIAYQSKSGASDRTGATLRVLEGYPVAAFSVSGTLEAGRELRFDNLSRYANNYRWDFGDGEWTQSESPTHIYPAPGSYNVRLIASLAGEAFADTAVQAIVVDSVVVSAAFDVTGNLWSGFPIHFVNLSRNATIFEWNFGDGRMSDEREPTIVYDSAATYTVLLTARTSEALGLVFEYHRELTIEVGRAILDYVNIFQIPWTDSTGAPWDSANGPDLFFIAYRPDGSGLMANMDVFMNAERRQFPLTLRPDGEVLLPRDEWAGEYLIELHDLDFGRDDNWRNLIGAFRFSIDRLIERHGRTDFYGLVSDSLLGGVGLRWR